MQKKVYMPLLIGAIVISTNMSIFADNYIEGTNILINEDEIIEIIPSNKKINNQDDFQFDNYAQVEVTETMNVEFDLNNLDNLRGSQLEQTVKVKDGEIYLKFKPYDLNRLSTSNTTNAKVGSLQVGFKTTFGRVEEANYIIDINKVNSRWRIENAYDLFYDTRYMSKVINESLQVNRMEATSNYNASASARLVINIFDNSWITIDQETYLIKSEISNNGKLKLTISY